MEPEAKKILIITYYWPPAGGPGVQRWLKFAKYLPEFGWKPVIYTPENPSYPLVDETLLKEIPEGIETVRTKIWEPYQIAEKLSKSNRKFKGGQFDVGKNQSWKAKLSIWVRGNFFIPDARVFWVKPSVQFLRKYLEEQRFDALVTTGPPHSMHLIGLELKKYFPTLKWIADFRDPWTEISYYKHLKLTEKSDRKHRELEAKVFRTADITLATSYTDAENFAKKGANAVCITNGFDVDKEHFSHTVDKQSKAEEKFTLSYIGVLEQLRNPEILWNVLNEIILQHEDFAQNFRLKFAGRIDDRILNQIKEMELRKSVKNLGYVSHDRAVQEMNRSHLLLITNFPEESSKGIIPGKIFEYLATGNQILSFGPKNADVATILNKTGAGRHFGYNDREKLSQFMMEKYAMWKNGKLEQNSSDIQEFSRKNLTGQLAEIIG